MKNLGKLNPDTVRQLLEMREKDPDTFMRIVLKALKGDPDYALTDDATAETKISALDQMLEYFTEIEEYEECAFLNELKRKIVGKED